MNAVPTGGQNMASDPLELESQTILCYLTWMLGTELARAFTEPFSCSLVVFHRNPDPIIVCEWNVSCLSWAV